MPLKNYCEIEDIENYILTEIASAFEAQVEKWIESIESYIDKYTGRNFKADDKASVKKYDGVCPSCGDSFGTHYGSGKELFIDECVAEEPDDIVLKIDGEVVDEDEYLLYPANELPKTRIQLKDTNSYIFTRGLQNIEVEAKWGYSVDPPADIVLATVVLVTGIINYKKGGNIVKSETIGNYSVTYGDEIGWSDFNRAREILDNYKKISV